MLYVLVYKEGKIWSRVLVYCARCEKFLVATFLGSVLSKMHDLYAKFEDVIHVEEGTMKR